MSHSIHVDTRAAGGSTGYDVVIGAGLLSELPSLISAVAPAAAYAVIMPDDVRELYGDGVLERMLAADLRAELFVFGAGESSKTRETWAALTDGMLQRRFGRDSCVIAFGGGVTGDLGGFVAATYMRGVPVVQVPTTLLAMIDASVGGKTGVDTAAGKNLVGAFHPPVRVVIDPMVLGTLSPLELRSGLAEAVKHGAIADASYFDWIEGHAADLLALEPAAVEQLVRRSVEIKADVVADDPFERGRRAILNFGHTVGHAIELHERYSLAHGYAVAEGMIAEADIGERAGVTAAGTRDRLAGVLQALGLPAEARPTADLIDVMRMDKKARGTRPRFALLERIGSAARTVGGEWTHAVDEALLNGVGRTGPGV